MTSRRLRIGALVTSMVSGWLAFQATVALGQVGNTGPFDDIERNRLNQTYVVRAPALNFRTEPSPTGTQLSVVQQGEYLLKTGQVLGEDGEVRWIRTLRSNGLEGWVSARQVSPVSDALATVERASAFLNTLDLALAAPLPKIFGELQVGFVYAPPISDGGWTHSHDMGRQAMEQLSFVTRTSYIEAAPQDAGSVTAAIDQLVEEGSNLIFAANHGYADPLFEAAKRHPDVVFMHSSGLVTGDNVGTYFGRIYEARYLSGIVAGAVTKSNVIGFVAAFPIPEVIRGINAFALGAQSINPDVRVEVEWTNTWYGPGLERTKTEVLLDRNADVIAIHQNSPAAIQVAAQQGAYAIGFHSDMSAFGPEKTLTSVVWDWGVIYKQIALELREGVWDPEQLWWGLDRGVVDLTPLSDQVPRDIKALVDQRRSEIIEGKRQVFAGPIRDDQGGLRVAEDDLLEDEDLLEMNYYVLGVEGGILPITSKQALPDRGI